jgi:hypothetical protein
MITLTSFTKAEDAHMARARLEGSGIDAWVTDDLTVNVHPFLSNAIGGVKVQVLEADVSRAREVLGLAPIENEGIRCPYCASGRIAFRQMSLLTAVAFSLGVLLPFATRKVDCVECKRVFRVDRRGAVTT